MSRVVRNIEASLTPSYVKGENVYSEFLITVTNQHSFPSRNSSGFDEMVEKLERLANFLLKKDTIKKMLVFEDEDLHPNRTREDYYKMIDVIDPERTASVEWGQRSHKLHTHINFYIIHNTRLLVNKSMVERVASIFLHLPQKYIRVNIQGSGKPSFKRYTLKYGGPGPKSE